MVFSNLIARCKRISFRSEHGFMEEHFKATLIDHDFYLKCHNFLVQLVVFHAFISTLTGEENNYCRT